MFLPALLYLYMALLLKDVPSKPLIKAHLIAPLLVHVSYLLVKFGLYDFYCNHIADLVSFVNAFIFFSYIFYLIKGTALLTHLKPLILPKIHRRYVVFYYTMFIYGIFLVSTALIPYLTRDEDYYKTFMFLSQDVYISLAIIVNTAILIFAIIESPILKNQIYGSKIYTGYDNISNESNISQFIKDIFEDQKLFTHADFDLKSCLKAHGIKDSDFKLFLKKEYDQTPISFINTYRVQEFKAAVLLDENSKYSIMGIAQKVGFKSKATFYRNFKAIEGVTPKQYCSNSITAERISQ